MKTGSLTWIATALVLTIAAAFLLWDGSDAARSMVEIAALEAKLIEGKCTQRETVDRWLLQQSWFHDQDFRELAGAFGQYSFSMYERGAPEKYPLEGAYCINGPNLVVQYFDRRFVPVRLRVTDMAVDFGTKLKPLGTDTFGVRELTRERMILRFASDGRDHVFYRKN